MALPAVVLENTSAVAQTNLPYTFAQIFAKGDLPGGSAAALAAPGGVSLPCQLNVHQHYPDGSIKHASVALVVPAVAGSAAVAYSFTKVANGPTGAAPVPADYPNLSATVKITDYGTLATGPEPGVVYNASLAPLLAAGTFKLDRVGPIMSEWIVRAPLRTAAGVEHPHLHARFYVQVFKGSQRARVRVVIENAWAKARTPTPTTGSAFENVSHVPVIYAYEIHVGGVLVEKREFNGFHHVLMTFNSSGTYHNFATGIPSDSTVYTAAATIDGVRKNISVIGSAVQTYGELFAAITSQLGGLGTCDNKGNGGLRITSNSVGPGSTVQIDFGTLMPALLNCGITSTSTSPVNYTATITVNGTAKPISVVSSKNITFAQLCALLNTQLGGIAKAIPQVAAPGVRIVATSTGTSDGVVITDGNLFARITQYTLKQRRPFRGDEHIQYQNSFWTKTHWQGGAAPTTHVRQDRAYWTSTHTWPNFPPEVTGSATSIAKLVAEMNENGAIGQNGITFAFMGATGYAPGIGVLSEWASMAICNQGKDIWDVTLKQCDLIGSWSMFARDYDTDLPINFIKWPKATFSPTASDSKNSLTGLTERLPISTVPSHLPSNPNNADVSHHPDFAFVPYMATGETFYLECLLMHHNFTILDMNAAGSYRDGGKMIFKGQGQVRGQAWSFRTLAHTAYAIPDDHPQKAVVKLCMAENVQWYNSKYVNPAGELRNPFGHFGGLIYSRPEGSGLKNANAPWQDDFVTMSIGRLVELGFREFMPLLEYKSEQMRGRMTSGDDFAWQLASNYTLQYRDNATSPSFTTWREVYYKGFSAAITAHPQNSPEFNAAAGVTENNMSGYPTSISGYPANMQPALAVCAQYKLPGCEAAWTKFDSRRSKPDYNTGPQWRIAPRALTEVVEVPMVELRQSGANGLGGAVSEIALSSAIFDSVEQSESSAGRTEYRCVYVKNNDPVKTIFGAVYWLSGNTPSTGTDITAGLGTSPANGVEQTVAGEASAPAGVAFTGAASKAAGIALGDLAPLATRAVWLRRITNPGTAAVEVDTFIGTVEGSILS